MRAVKGLAKVEKAMTDVRAGGRSRATTRSAGLRTEIDAGGHALIADEPLPDGTNAGPSPYDLLAAALAACTSMTLQLYARHKGLDLERATVTVRHRKVHAEDCADCETRHTGLDQLERVIELSGSLSRDARERLLAIAERCPVHRTLASKIRIRTTLADR
jgi:putative redox protein